MRNPVATGAEIARRRAICATCPQRITLTKRALGKEIKFDKCSMCGCALASMTAVASKKCPAHNW